MPITHTWRGYGSAIFLEFGRLTHTVDKKGYPRVRRDGSPLNPFGEMEAMIESGWRVDADSVVVADSRSDPLLIERAINGIKGLTVISVHALGSPPEITIELSGGKVITTYTDQEPVSQWALFDRRLTQTTWLHVREGSLTLEAAAA